MTIRLIDVVNLMSFSVSYFIRYVELQTNCINFAVKHYFVLTVSSVDWTYNRIESNDL